MQVFITARHCEISQTFRDRITSEVEKLTKIFERINRVEIIVSEDSGVSQVEINFTVNQQAFNAKGQGASHQLAFDIALEKAERQLRKFKGKLVGRRAIAAKEDQTGN
ncbi:MAG: Ribosome hibernation promoting factor [Candidatus Latescibacteria bacterium ADurb.Bin168]|nr:MAG: Ribosome hibernation promoting factor [Candidatus Latescibacteria bacterium ADurb.Bin168]